MIGENLLIHTVTLKKASGIDRDRNKTFEEYRIVKTRMYADIGQSQTSEGETPSDTATLFIDATQSKIANEEIELAQVKMNIGDKVEWNGRTFEVRSVRPCYTDGEKIHHWEVALK